MQRVPSCARCFKPYAFQGSGRPVGQRIPRLLSCGHTFCHGCVAKLEVNSQPRVLICPTCQGETPVSGGKNQLKNLPTNLYILGILINNVRATFEKDVMNGELSDFDVEKCLVVNTSTAARGPSDTGSGLLKKDSEKICDECRDSPAISECQKCEARFCENCFDAVHMSSRTLRMHKAVPLALTNLAGVFSQTCDMHEGRALEFYDLSDEKLICSLCIVSPAHEGHKFIPANKMTEEAAEKIKQSLENVKKVHTQLLKSKTKLFSLIPEIKAECCEVVQLIHEHFQDLHTKLQAREVDLIKEVKAAFCSQSLPVKVAGEITSKSSELGDLIDQCTAAISAPSMVMKVGETLLSNLAEFEDIPCILLKSCVQDLVTISYPEEFLQALHSYGSIVSESCSPKLVKISEQPDDENEVLEISAGAKDLPTNEPQSPPKSAPLLTMPSRQNLVYVTHVKNPCDFMVQHAADTERIENLMNAINNYCQGAKSVNDAIKSPQIGDLVCAQYSKDQCWYRARIIGEPQRASAPKGRNQSLPMVEVHFVDYGNTDVVSLSRLRKIRPEFADIPELATNCSLVDIVPPGQSETWPAQSIKAFGSIVREKELLMGVIKKSGGKFFVDLMSSNEDPTRDDDKPASVRDALVFLEVAHFSSPASTSNPEVVFPVRSYKKVAVPDEGETIEVTVTYTESPDAVYVMRDSGKEYTDTLRIIGQMSSMYSSQKGNQWQIFWPYKGLICAARFSGDQVWYRALVTDVSHNQTVQVKYVDFGNSEELPFSEIRRIPDHMTQLPMQAIKCRLAGIQPLDGETEWSDDCCAFLSESCDLNRYNMRVVEAQSDEPMSVVLYQVGTQQTTSVNQQIVLQSFAVLSSSADVECLQAEQPCSPASDSVVRDSADDTFSIDSEQNKLLYPKKLCYLPVEMPKTGKFQFAVSYVDKDCTIYGCIPDNSDYSLPEFMNHMQKICKENANDQVTQDQLSFNQPCCAEYADDNMWYRAEIVDFPTPSSVLVDYVDFGNRAEVPLTSINLNAAFLDIPKQCLPIKLDGLPQTPVEKAKVASLLEVLLVGNMCEAITSTKSNQHGMISVGKLSLPDGRDVVNVARKMMMKLRDEQVETPMDEQIMLCANPLKQNGVEPIKSKSKPESAKSLLGDTVLPAEGIAFDVTVTEISSRNVVYLQRNPTHEANPEFSHDPTRVIACDHINQLLDMSQRINLSNYFKGKPNLKKVWKNMLCCARYTEDELWYRAQICEVLSNDPLQAQVLYIDYGTSEVVGLERIKSFPAELVALPKQAFQCCIAGLDDGKDEEHGNSTGSLAKAVIDKNLICKVVTHGPPVVVELYDRVLSEDSYQDIPINQRVWELDRIMDSEDDSEGAVSEEGQNVDQASTEESAMKLEESAAMTEQSATKVEDIYQSDDDPELENFGTDGKLEGSWSPESEETIVGYDHEGLSTRPQLLTPAQFLLKKEFSAERELAVKNTEEEESQVD